MSPHRSELEAESWAFALAIYARPGVAEACLALQNEAGVDVMMLLMGTFAAVKHRILLTPEEINALDDACRPWREQIVWRLRAIRTDLKSGPRPAPNIETEQLRSKVKAIELEAEKRQNQLLAECLPLRTSAQPHVTAEQLRAVLVNIVSLFADRRGTKPNLASSIDAIAEAAQRIS
jgi:uncharacterized protein (TIGR02444 family)